MLIKKILFKILIPLLLTTLFLSCAANKAASNIGHDIGLMHVADSVFDAGNYQGAKSLYSEIKKSGKSPGLRALAQYKIGYLNIYYENPFANYEEALVQFKEFVRDNPTHSRVGEANNYIRILSSLQRISIIAEEAKNIPKENTSEVEDNKKQDELINNLLGLQRAYLKCNSRSDSLSKKITILESVIDELENIK